MTTRTTTKAGHITRRMIIAMVAMGIVALALGYLAHPVYATHVTPTHVDGNHTCAQLGDFGHEFKVEPVVSGTYDDPNSDFSVEITVNDTAAGPTLDFESNIGVDAVFVKGGDEGNLYSYSPPATADTGLHAPLNASGKWAGLSHVSFCFTDTPQESVSESIAESVPESQAESVPESIAESVPESEAASGEQSVEAGTGTPAESTPNGALSLNGVGALPTILFSLILLASLGTLAYANVKSVRS